MFSLEREIVTDASSVVWTLINNGKLANQIATLVSNVVKGFVDKPLYLVVFLLHPGLFWELRDK